MTLNQCWIEARVAPNQHEQHVPLRNDGEPWCKSDGGEAYSEKYLLVYYALPAPIKVLARPNQTEKQAHTVNLEGF